MSPEDEPQDEDFASMLEESLQEAPQRLRAHAQGETVEGTIVSIRREVAFLDIGGRSEATIEIEELTDDDGQLEVEVGDRIRALVVSTEGGLRLSRKLARGAALKEQLRDAFHAGLPVEGRVESTNKGGYDVRIGGQRAFCPISQIDLGFTSDPAVHEGQVYTFRILEYREGKDLVVSRRALLEEEEREKAEEVRRTIVPDAVLPGRVASVLSYGAFVDLGGGIQGLLHVSEMGWSRVSDPSTLVRPGDAIQVKVLAVDEAKGKISLGLKQLQSDPWTTLGPGYAVGQVRPGRVTRVTEFGAFVELEPGIEGLAHVSTFDSSGTSRRWKDSVLPGTTGMFEIQTVDLERRRIGVALLAEGSSRAEAARAKAEGRDVVAPAAQAAETPGFGTLADKLRAALDPPRKKR